MKSKKMGKKLNLNKATVVNLSRDEQSHVVGATGIRRCATNVEGCDTDAPENSCYATGILYTCGTSVPFLTC